MNLSLQSVGDENTSWPHCSKPHFLHKVFCHWVTLSGHVCVCNFSFSFSKSICQPALNLNKVLIRAIIKRILWSVPDLFLFSSLAIQYDSFTLSTDVIYWFGIFEIAFENETWSWTLCFLPPYKLNIVSVSVSLCPLLCTLSISITTTSTSSPSCWVI